MSKSYVSQTHSNTKLTTVLQEVSFYTVSVSHLAAGESNSQMVSLTDQLSQKSEELLRHQEEIAQLLSQIVELQHRVKEVGPELLFLYVFHY